MKLSVLFFALFASTSAFASQMANPLLEYEKRNTAASPNLKYRYICKVYADGMLLKQAFGPAVRSVPVITNVQWNSEVSDAAFAQVLIQKAKTGTTAKENTPVGSQAITHLAIETVGAGAPNRIVLSSPSERNMSRAAQALIRFLDHNCENQ